MKRITSIAVLAGVATLSAAPPVGAHSWYPAACCSGQDCHPVPCETLRQNESGGVTYTPTGNSFRRDKVLPSEDASCHICTSSADGGGIPFCAFVLDGS